MLFANRVEAGRRLAERLEHLRGRDAVVVGLPRGGVPVAYQVAQALVAPLDVVVVRKLGVPFQPELAMGAIGEDGVRIVNQDIVRSIGVGDRELAAVEAAERAELERRVERFRGDAPRVPLQGRTVVVVDDGIATGSTVRAACQVVRAQGAAHVVVAVPVAPPRWTAGLRGVADELICLATPAPFFAIGEWYADFGQTSDEEVVEYLARRSRALGPRPVGGTAPGGSGGSGGDAHRRDEDVTVEAGAARLDGRLTVPAAAAGVVVFAHGSGSSRHSPRNRFVAQVLQQAGLGTLLFDLLTPEEELDRANVFDIGLLGRRLVEVTRWLREQPEVARCPVGYFGASTGAAAALWAAAEPDAAVAAVVSRGGRPDLVDRRLGAVTAPTLLVVGASDKVVIGFNREAQARLRCENRLVLVPGATHLFAEPGALEHVAALARDWFVDHFVAARRTAA